MRIPELHLKLFRETNTLDNIDPLLELVIINLFAHVRVGQDFLVVDFSYQKFNIDTVGSSAVFNFLLETVFPGGAGD